MNLKPYCWGTISMILCVLSNGTMFATTISSNINSNIFTRYMMLLDEWIWDQKDFNYDSVIWILDNWRSHKSATSIRRISKLKTKRIFIPPYSPMLAPVEQASRSLNTRIKRKVRTKGVNLNKLESRNEIFECVKLFTNNEINGIFKYFIQILESFFNIILERVEHYTNNSFMI